MLQRRIGTICTRSGCAVCVRPRRNLRTDRALRLIVVAIAIRRATPRAQTPHLLADFHRAGENRPDRDEAPQLVPRDGRQPRRRHAAAVAAVGRAAELARRDLRRQIGRHGHRRSREHALVRRRGRLGVNVEQPWAPRALVPHTQCQQVGHHALAIWREPLRRDLADLRRVQAHPDLSTSCLADQNFRNSSR